MRTILAAGVLFPALLVAGACLAGVSDELPPNAVPGHCYQHVTTQPVTETYQEEVIDVPEHTATRVTEAVYGEKERSILVSPGRVEHIHHASTWRTVTETEVIRPERICTEVIPAQYDVVRERVLVREARTEWRRGPRGPVSDPDMPRNPSYLDVLCLVEIPAEYRWETEHVLREPERVVHTTIPAETRTRTHQVIDQAAWDEERQIGPVYEVVKDKVILQPERTETYTVKAITHMATRTRTVTPGRLEWREVECRHPRHPRHDCHCRRHLSDTDGERGALDLKLSPPGTATKALGL
jgi:hypothetical protein